MKSHNETRVVFKRKLRKDIQSINSIIIEMVSWFSHTEVSEYLKCVNLKNSNKSVPLGYKSCELERYTTLLETVCERSVKLD